MTAVQTPPADEDCVKQLQKNYSLIEAERTLTVMHHLMV